jgi:hypothetical protein
MDRIIIGEVISESFGGMEKSGLPISAPIELKKLGDAPGPAQIRWHKKKDTFILEKWTGIVWIEVPCVMDE